MHITMRQCTLASLLVWNESWIAELSNSARYGFGLTGLAIGIPCFWSRKDINASNEYLISGLLRPISAIVMDIHPDPSYPYVRRNYSYRIMVIPCHCRGKPRLPMHDMDLWPSFSKWMRKRDNHKLFYDNSLWAPVWAGLHVEAETRALDSRDVKLLCNKHRRSRVWGGIGVTHGPRGSAYQNKLLSAGRWRWEKYFPAYSYQSLENLLRINMNTLSL